MSKAPNHTCAICGAQYYSCDQCPEVKSVTPWRTICDTEAHYRIFNIIAMVNSRIITKEKAKELLGEMEIQEADIAKVLPEVKAVIESILVTDESVKGKTIYRKNKMKE